MRYMIIIKSKGQIQIIAILLILIVFGIFTYEGYQRWLAPEKEITTEKEITVEEKSEEKPVENSGELKPEVPISEAACQNECLEIGIKRCSGNGYQICGDYDIDNCLEWNSITYCTTNTICQNGNCVQQEQKEQKCSDGTLFGQCSINKPKYCDRGNLVDKCNICGCLANYVCQSEGFCEKLKPLVVVVVDSSVQSGIQSSLNQYKADLEAEGYLVTIYPFAGGTSNNLRNYLQERLKNNLVGSLLVGDLPIAWFEFEHPPYPIDLFYMDLDGNWIDSDNNGIYDDHKDGGGDMGPEIWIGRLTPNGFGSAINLLNNYFRKNHIYRKGQLTLTQRALFYAALEHMDFRASPSNLSKVYGNNVVIVPYEDSSKNEYTNRLKEGYQWIELYIHSSQLAHWFERTNESIYSDTIYNVNPKAFFYILLACFAGDYTTNKYLGGAYIFSPNYSLAVFSSPIAGGAFIPEERFYSILSENNTLGEAYKDAIAHDADAGAGTGTTLLGDPTLRLSP